MVHRVKGGTPGGGTLVMTLEESVECQCTTDSTCLIMEMLFGGTLYLFSTVSGWLNHLHSEIIMDMTFCTVLGSF